MFPVPGLGFRGLLWAGLTENQFRTNRTPVPNNPGPRTGPLGTWFWSVRIGLTNETGPKPTPEGRPGDRKHG